MLQIGMVVQVRPRDLVYSGWHNEACADVYGGRVGKILEVRQFHRPYNGYSGISIGAVSIDYKVMFPDGTIATIQDGMLMEMHI